MKYGYSIYDTDAPEFYIESVWEDEEFHDDVAEEAAEDFHNNHDGWEHEWPLNVCLFIDGAPMGVFTVEREYDPTFSARKAK